MSYNLPPATIAQLDQQHQAINEYLDGLVDAVRAVIADHGPVKASAIAAVVGLDHVSPERVASAFGVALVRLAQSTQEPTS